MKLYIPEIGDKIKLTSDWTFRLFHERRNENLFNLLKLRMYGCGGEYFLQNGKKYFFQSGRDVKYGWHTDDGEALQFSNHPHSPDSYYAARAGKIAGVSYHQDEGGPITINAGQVLSIDRVYIRRGASDFSSVTFNYIGAPKGSGRVRFWALPM